MNFFKNVVILTAFIWSLIGIIKNCEQSKIIKELSGKQDLDITESRRREDLLLQEVKLLSYQTDIITQEIKK